MTEPIPIVLVDDHAIWRDGVRSMLRKTEFRVVGEASSGREAQDVVRQTHPRLVLLDIRMVGGDGLETLVELKDEHPQLIVVMVTTYDNPIFMARAVVGGAAGYLLKGVDRADFIAALRRVTEGEMLLSVHDLSRFLRGVNATGAGSGDLITPLSARELDVLRLLSTGLTNREIGAMLFIAESTVKTHVDHIIAKLGVSDRVQAAVWAARQGLMEAGGDERSNKE